ncbi:MAG: hypothetical protein JKY55_17010 [Aliivibrio sp.]|nr:hypothetical protein [Aliivibrio sp.]
MGYVDPDGREAINVGVKIGWGFNIKAGWSNNTNRPFAELGFGYGLYAGGGYDPLDEGKGKAGCSPNASLGYNYNGEVTIGPYGKSVNAGAEIDLDGNITVNHPDLGGASLNALNVNKGLGFGGSIGIVISMY